MKKLSFGETAILTNNEEYTCFANVRFENEDYAFIMSHTEPVRVKIVRQDLVDGELNLTIVKDEEMKKKILKLYKEFFASSVESLAE
jgi:hypothetical protein